MSKSIVCLAVDLGASSGRVLACEFVGAGFELHEIHRFPNGGVRLGSHLMWNLPGLWQEILNGLTKASQQFPTHEIVSVGVDTWGVDFALLDESRQLMGLPYHYRDQHTDGGLERAFEVVPKSEIYRQTGLQFMTINSLYQLLAIRDARPEWLGLARHFLMMPDLFHWLLSGELSNEVTDVSTSQLYDPNQGDWARDLIGRFGLPSGMFGSLCRAGQSVGGLMESVAQATGLQASTQVVLPGTHDTASAVVAVPVERKLGGRTDWCYISSGTWSLMGVELEKPIINDETARLNFTNEAGVGGTTRLLKNIAGLWLVQECRRVWSRAGREYSWEQMAQMARSVPACQFLVDPDSPELAAPENMPEALRQLAGQSGRVPETDAEILRCAFDSLARRYSQVLRDLEQVLGHAIESIYIVGGGVQNELLCQLTADACDRQVIAGPSEATAIGNAMIQATHRGMISSVGEARSWLAAAHQPKIYVPQDAAVWKRS